MKMNRGSNTKERWEQKHIYEYDLKEQFNFKFLTDDLSYHKVASELIRENIDLFDNKSLLEIGCAGGDFVAYLKKYIIPDFRIDAYDFSETAINAAIGRCPNVNFYVHDFITNPPIDSEYGIVCMFETIEHIAEGKNYEILDQLIENSEYVLLSTVNTIDDCFGEHISHYTLDTFDEKGYDVVWKTRLDTIDMSNVGDYGDYYHFLVLLKGKL